VEEDEAIHLPDGWADHRVFRTPLNWRGILATLSRWEARKTNFSS